MLVILRFVLPLETDGKGIYIIFERSTKGYWK